MRRTAISFLLLLFASPVFAEVCDKAVGESWRPQHGPVWLFNPVGFPIRLTILIGIFVLVVWAKRSWLAYVAAAYTAFGAFGGLSDVIEDHSIYRMQIQEGCRSVSTYLMDISVFAILTLVFTWLGYRSSKSNVKAIRT